MAFPELPDDRRARPRRYRGSAEDGDPGIPDEFTNHGSDEQVPLAGSASRRGAAARRADDGRPSRRATPPDGPRRARVDDRPEPPDEEPSWPPRGRRALRDDRDPSGNNHPVAGRNGHHRNGSGVNGSGTNGSAHGPGVNGAATNGGPRDGSPADRLRDAYPYTGSGPDGSPEQPARGRRHVRSDAPDPVEQPTGRRRYRDEPDDRRADDRRADDRRADDRRADDRGAAPRADGPRRPQTNGYAPGRDDAGPPPARGGERPARREGPPRGAPPLRGPGPDDRPPDARAPGRAPLGPPGGPADHAPPARGPAHDGRGPAGPVPGGPAGNPMNGGSPRPDHGGEAPRRRRLAPEDVPPGGAGPHDRPVEANGVAPPVRRRRAEPEGGAADEGDPGRTRRRPPPPRRGHDPDAAYADDVPDDEDDVDTTALPTGRDRRAPRRRPVDGAATARARAPGRPEPPVEDEHAELDDADAADEADGPREGKRSGPVGIGGRIAALTSRRSRGADGEKKPTSFWRELPLLIGVALLLTFLIQTFVAKVFVIPSGSMETTLNGCTGCDNDRVLVDKVTYNFTDIKPGDVVVFRGPDSWSSSEYELDQTTNPVLRGLQTAGSLIGFAPPDEKDFVKRVIATGGQTVACCDALNQVMVDGQPLEEPYIYYLPEAGPARQIPFGPITVPQGEMWMMGDSRNNSADSRAAGHGPVPEENVIGKVRLIVLPFDRFGWVDAVNPQTSAQAAADHGLPQGGALALGMMGAFPFALGRRRLLVRRAEEQRFLPVARHRKRWRRST